MTKSRGVKRLAVVLTMAMLTVGVSSIGIGTAGAGSSACSGDPLKLMIVSAVDVSGAIQSTPEIPAAAKAAAKAVNKSCEAGQPIVIITCDDHATPNGATDCARQAVEEGVVSVTSYSYNQNVILPILEEAGIPDVGGVLVDPAPNPMSFSTSPSPAMIFAIPFAEVSLGASKVASLYNDNPETAALLGILPGVTERAGIEIVDNIPVPPDAIDMTTYVAQALDKGADSLLPALSGVATAGLAKAVTQQGKSLEEIIVGTGGVGLRPQEIKAIGSDADGIVLANTIAPVSDKKNKGVKQYLKELKAAKQSTKNVSEPGLQIWSAVHFISGFMKLAATKDAAGLLGVLKSPQGVVNRPELAPVDFSKPAFEPCPAGTTCTATQDSILSSLPIWQNTYIATRVENGKQVLLTDGFVPILESFEPEK